MTDYIRGVGGSGSGLLLSPLGQAVHGRRSSLAGTAPADTDGDRDPEAGRPGGLGAMLQDLGTVLSASLQDLVKSTGPAAGAVESAVDQSIQRTARSARVDNDGDADPASADSAAADQAARQAFFKLLTDHGISPEQFRKDLVASVQNSADPRFDRGTAFSSIPAGLNLDAEA